MNRSQILYFLLLLFVGMSCSKQQPIAPVETHTYPKVYTLVNTREMPLQVDLYLSVSDWGNPLNLKYSCIVPDSSHYNVPLSKIDTMAKYYCDVHTTDYMYSNWGDGGNLTVFMGYGGSFDLRFYNLTQARWYFLRDNESTTSWKAIDRHYEGQPSDWSHLNDTTKYMRLVLNRDKTGYVTQARYDNTIGTDTIIDVYAYPVDWGASLALSSVMSATRYTMVNTDMPVAGNIGHITSRDTIFLRDYAYYWKMVRD